MATLIRVLSVTVSTRVFIFLGVFFFGTCEFCFVRDFFLASDDGFKINGTSGFGVGMSQDYVMTDVYWLLYIYIFDLCKGKTTRNEFYAINLNLLQVFMFRVNNLSTLGENTCNSLR